MIKHALHRHIHPFIKDFKLRIRGKDRKYKYQSIRFSLNSQKNETNETDFAALSYIAALNIPNGTIGIHCPMKDETHFIHSTSWKNIWGYGLEIKLCGFVTCGEFWDKCTRIPRYSRVFQQSKTKEDFLR